MTETRLTATLPQLDIQILRREETDPREQELIIRLRAAPAFRAVADHLAARMAGDGLPMAPFALALPYVWWAQAWRAAWLPWLTALPALPTCPGDDAALAE